MEGKDYIVIVQCHLVKQRCSGYVCERAFHHRTGGFADYNVDKHYRTLYMTCGGCCGRALHRKLRHMIRKIKTSEDVDKDRIIVQLSSCITLDSNHGPSCPHLDYLKELIARLGLDVRENTTISKTAEKRRKDGTYKSR